MTDLSQRLADIHSSSILWFVIVLTIIRLLLVRRQSPSARAVVEIVDAGLFAAVLMFMIVLPFVVKSFYIPSGSMRPTLIDDDHILVNKFLYRVGPPSHGDVVVFTAPPEALRNGSEAAEPNGAPTDYIKRLIGLPGDTIEVHGGYIKVGPLGQQEIKTHSDVRTSFGLDDRDNEHVKFLTDGIMVYKDQAWTKYSKDEVAAKLGFAGGNIEIVPGVVIRNRQTLSEPYIAEDPDYDLKIKDGQSVTHDEQGTKMDGEDFPGGEKGFETMATQPLPPNRVMVFGDNRNDSNDSSRWGPLEEKRLVGKAFLIFFPFNRVRVIH